MATRHNGAAGVPAPKVSHRFNPVVAAEEEQQGLEAGGGGRWGGGRDGKG